MGGSRMEDKLAKAMEEMPPTIKVGSASVPFVLKRASSKAEDKVITKAILDLIMSSKENVDRFLMEQYEIRLTDHERDKKGKLVKCRAYFARKVVKYEEI